jgi:hypothetical protein
VRRGTISAAHNILEAYLPRRATGRIWEQRRI